MLISKVLKFIYSIFSNTYKIENENIILQDAFGNQIEQ